MKRFILVSMIALAAAGITGCGDDDGTKADLSWKNDTADKVSEIVWVSGGKEDQRWSGEYAGRADSATSGSGTQTGFQGIKELAGVGQCNDSSGAFSEIILDPANSTGIVAGATSTNSAVIQENAAATLWISGAKKK